MFSIILTEHYDNIIESLTSEHHEGNIVILLTKRNICFHIFDDLLSSNTNNKAYISLRYILFGTFSFIILENILNKIYLKNQ